MHRPGSDTNNMRMEDFLCDFCRRAWDGSFAMVEGHQGSLICGDCLAAAYRALVIDDTPTAPAGYSCTMCLEERPQPGFTGPAHAGAVICPRCCRQSATRLEKEMEGAWKRPE